MPQELGEVRPVFGHDHVGAGDAGDFGDVGVVETASVDLVVGGAADEGEAAIAGEGVDDEALHDLVLDELGGGWGVIWNQTALSVASSASTEQRVRSL
jgi:hypothetical protein